MSCITSSSTEARRRSPRGIRRVPTPSRATTDSTTTWAIGPRPRAWAWPRSVNGLPAGPVSVSGGDGTTGMLTANLVGNVTIRAQSGALTTSTSFPVVAAATTTALDAPPSVQYSDLLALTATVTPANLGNGQMVRGSVTCHAGAAPLGPPVAVASDGRARL